MRYYDMVHLMIMPNVEYKCMIYDSIEYDNTMITCVIWWQYGIYNFVLNDSNTFNDTMIIL